MTHGMCGQSPVRQPSSLTKAEHEIFCKHLIRMFLRLLLLVIIFKVSMSQSIIQTLPGFSGNLPFKLETGYIGVGKLDEVQLFYYFIESERNPRDDLLLLWLTGGPGCSTFSGLVYEIGPLTFNYNNSRGTKPTFKLNPYSWTKVANIIFLDQPVGTGFSYATKAEGYNTSDTSSAAQTYEFLRKWLMVHPEFLSNPLYISGDSYSGITVPIIVQEVLNGLHIGHQPPMNLQGYILGNPVTDAEYDFNSRILFAYRKALVSKSLYESTKRNCKGEYTTPDPNDTACMSYLQAVTQCLGNLDEAQILEPNCERLSPKPKRAKWDHRSLGDSSLAVLLSTPQSTELWCRNYHYLYSYVWANDKTVRSALHIREGTIGEWLRCNGSLSYDYDVSTSIDYERNLTREQLRALIYSGDHDMVIPYLGTIAWIESFNLTVQVDWYPWLVDGQVAGYNMNYAEEKYSLTYATIKGGGHTAPEYKPNEALAMIERWLAHFPL
ncbi:serine carboxypeptidase-like 17 [Durio zibethinus]|uniref:Serine carboxypeptidase-like 17 n=1 Tax=Durio zibethinus TaxID=66656 RepID=A0A6P6ABG3_DURZI|nr:serine carboxypeptidase-like 17 [Durio zibethinus]